MTFTTEFPSALRIARKANLEPLKDIASGIGIGEHLLVPYGESVAKIKLDAMEELADRPKAKYVLVSAITPTPLGEGKTTTTVGLGQAFRHIGKTATVAIRQPSMGPTFGIKGGAAGGSAKARLLRRERFREVAGVHRQDAPLDLLRPDAHGGARGLDITGQGRADFGGGWLYLPHLRRDEDDAGAQRAPRGRTHRYRREWRGSGAVVRRE